MIDARTRLSGLIGNPVGHSRSPLIHNHLAELTGVNTAYLCFCPGNEPLYKTVEALKNLDAAGFNVTIPYKTDVIEMLDSTDENVRSVLACNTVKISEGRLSGFNTDIEGFLSAFFHETGSLLNGKKVVLLGGGGAARGMLQAVAKSSPLSVAVLNRTPEKIEQLRPIYPALLAGGLDSSSLQTLTESDVILNATSAGMSPDTENDPIWFYNGYTQRQIVYDTIYNPVKTALLRNAARLGATTANGLSMLVFQAILSFEIIHGVSIDSMTAGKVLEYIKDTVYREGRNAV